MRTLRCWQVAELPTLESAEEIVAATGTVFGQLVVLAVARDSAASVHLYDGDQGWRRVPLAGAAVAYPLVDLLPDGDILVVSSRCRRFRDGTAEDNAHVFDPAGAHVRSFCLGDGIEHIGVDAAGTIWVGYFDEGVFGNLGWDDPIGAAGLVRFDGHGRRLWTYQPPAGAEPIADCYALNVDARTTWAYYYTGFPLVQITDGRARAHTPTPVRGARHLLVHRDEVLFIGEYGDPMRLTFSRLTDDTVAPAVLVDTDDAPLHAFHPIATHGSRLYLHADHRVLWADLAENAGNS
ncbi:hypothetical protein O7635_15455 [Asanoa sp. WMMD1127]|uniref:hypothetical protein n=1 Tax=Asanoa sp. WMMD1127 TaxID=3016107 RepID=UPI002415FF96|nr:hypothetical protein [Asanoa sp. WMMD1127]MDG4823252.1 hypothetical protein [Asanoa sp. WMMD1127]